MGTKSKYKYISWIKIIFKLFFYIHWLFIEINIFWKIWRHIEVRLGVAAEPDPTGTESNPPRLWRIKTVLIGFGVGFGVGFGFFSITQNGAGACMGLQISTPTPTRPKCYNLKNLIPKAYFALLQPTTLSPHSSHC